MKLIFSTCVLSMLLISFFPSAEAGESSNDERQGNVDVERSLSSSFEWSGLYLKKSELCTSPVNGESCSEQFRDCLRIESGIQGYRVELHSTQADQHVCSFSLQMDAVDGVLGYQTQFGRILVKRNGDSLEISSKGIDPTALGLGVCGAHADIDGLKFSLARKSNTTSGCRSPN